MPAVPLGAGAVLVVGVVEIAVDVLRLHPHRQQAGIGERGMATSICPGRLHGELSVFAGSKLPD
jgi:hypothetical protein